MFFISEVTDINKQKFLTELGKLLTFMYEEDRQNALALYSRMFDKAEDETALIQLLGSPTRQAVIVARAYNAKEHKLDVYSHSRESSVTTNGDEMPDYVRAISQIHQTAVSQHIVAADVASGQFTLFSDDDEELTEPYSYEEPFDAAVYAPVAPVEPMPVQEAEPVIAEPSPVEVEEPAVPEEPAEEPVPEEPAPAPVESASAEPVPAPAEPQADQADEPIAILIEDEDLPAEPVPEEPAVMAPAEPVAPAMPEEAAPVIEVLDEEEEAPPVPAATVRKPKTFLLILFILVFAPLTLLGVGLLLIPTVFFLSLAVSVIAFGAMVLVAAFSGFAVLADIMVVLGIALIILALGLLFLWIFIWFIGGAIVGLVRSVFKLGGKWCYKEVPAV